MPTHYEKKRSLVKRARKHGFRARMKTKSGRAMINRKRRTGRSLSVRKKF
jgi:large subunit ribosomal protein L34